MTSIRSSRPLFAVVRVVWSFHLFWVALIIVGAGILILRLSTPVQ